MNLLQIVDSKFLRVIQNFKILKLQNSEFSKFQAAKIFKC